MEIISKENSLAVIIAIEDYRFSDKKTGIQSVDYARNDAEEFKKLLIDDFGLDESQIIMWLDEDASKSALENELPYEIQGLTKDDRFYFYYAGHGFYQGGVNRITAWDSHPFNLADTTVSIKDVLLDPLEKSNCDQSLIFIDACARELPKLVASRDLISNMDQREFENFIRSTSYTAMFLSCAPGENSYHSNILNHGIWTWHLLQALRGEMDDAIVNDYYITDSSLKNFLRYAVPRYIRKKTEIRGTQTPLAIVSSSSTFEIRKLPEIEDGAAEEFPSIELKYNKTYLRKLETKTISRLDGFEKRKGHFVPDDVNAYADSFVKRLLDDEIKEEIKEVYDSAKGILKLKKKDIDRYTSDGEGRVETEYFRYFIDVGQNPDDSTEALETRRLIIRVALSKLPEDFDDIFPVYLDEIVIPISGDLDFDNLVDRFENLEDKIGGRLSEDEDGGIIEYCTEDGSMRIIIQTDGKELIIHPRGQRGCLALIEQAEAGLRQITGVKRKLLK